MHMNNRRIEIDRRIIERLKKIPGNTLENKIKWLLED